VDPWLSAIQHQWNIATAAPEKKVRWPSAGDIPLEEKMKGAAIY
jgi:hypothetical protein